MRKRLLAVQGPTQFLAGYIAMEWERESEGLEPMDTVVLSYDFLMTKSQENELADSIKHLMHDLDDLRIIYIDSGELKKILNRRYEHAVKKFKKILGEEYFDEVYLAREYCGNGSLLILNAYQNAKKIAYGDSFGLVGVEENLIESIWSPPYRKLLSAIKTEIKKLFYGAPKKVEFDLAILTIPLDFWGRYLKKINIKIPSKKFAKRIMAEFVRRNKNLNEFSSMLIKKAVFDERYLFLLSNFWVCEWATLESELDLYEEIVRKVAPRNSTVYIKIHPRGHTSIFDRLKQRLEDTYQVISIANKEFDRIPIEVWRKMIDHCEVIPIFSSSAISLKYFYEKDSSQVLNLELIKKYIIAEKLNEVVLSEKINLEVMNKLNNWDEKSILWGGK
jgi:hypothetical protein